MKHQIDRRIFLKGLTVLGTLGLIKPTAASVIDAPAAESLPERGEFIVILNRKRMKYGTI